MPPRTRAEPRPYTAASSARPGVADRRTEPRSVVRFGNRLRAPRLAAELTQAEVAERAGLDVSYVSQLERGLRDPSLSSLESLARAFGLSLADFFADDSADALPPTVRTLTQELARLDEAALRDAVEIVRRFHGAVTRAASRRRG